MGYASLREDNPLAKARRLSSRTDALIIQRISIITILTDFKNATLG